jgi:FdhD protein
MAEFTTSINIQRYNAGKRESAADTVTRETALTIKLNGREIVTMLCSPDAVAELAAGYLQSEGLLTPASDIQNIVAEDDTVSVTAGNVASTDVTPRKLVYSSGGKGVKTPDDQTTLPSVNTNIELSAPAILRAMGEFQQRAATFQATGGTHSAALWDGREILIFREDIGRHNALDKVFGECLIKNIDTTDKAIITSGRVSSEILLKVARRRVPALLSKSAPTDAGVRLAGELGLTLVGFARGDRLNIYAGGERIK